jgi:hypothetical protein
LRVMLQYPQQCHGEYRKPLIVRLATLLRRVEVAVEALEAGSVLGVLQSSCNA